MYLISELKKVIDHLESMSETHLDDADVHMSGLKFFIRDEENDRDIEIHFPCQKQASNAHEQTRVTIHEDDGACYDVSFETWKAL